jgi:hypothetical protein
LLLKHGLQLVHIGQQVLAALVKCLAILHELHLARGAVQQARADDVGADIASLLSPDNGWLNAQLIEASGGIFL